MHATETYLTPHVRTTVEDVPRISPAAAAAAERVGQMLEHENVASSLFCFTADDRVVLLWSMTKTVRRTSVELTPDGQLVSFEETTALRHMYPKPQLAAKIAAQF